MPVGHYFKHIRKRWKEQRERRRKDDQKSERNLLPICFLNDLIGNLAKMNSASARKNPNGEMNHARFNLETFLNGKIDWYTKLILFYHVCDFVFDICAIDYESQSFRRQTVCISHWDRVLVVKYSCDNLQPWTKKKFETLIYCQYIMGAAHKFWSGCSMLLLPSIQKVYHSDTIKICTTKCTRKAFFLIFIFWASWHLAGFLPKTWK